MTRNNTCSKKKTATKPEMRERKNKNKNKSAEMHYKLETKNYKVERYPFLRSINSNTYLQMNHEKIKTFNQPKIGKTK
jgi:hypothetical protein